MFGKKEVLTAVGTLSCAIGIGFVMQNTADAERHYGSKVREIPAAQVPELTGASIQNSILDVQEITLTSAEFETEIDLPAADAEVVTVSAPKSMLEKPEEPEAISVPACEIVASARPVAAAMVDLTMEASCLPNERVTIHHNGMIFTETTSASGALSLKVPALAQDAVFIMAFSTGEGAVAQTDVEELADFDRTVLQWKGNSGFELHAREFGAEYGSKGHLWSNAPGSLADAVSGIGGVMTRHGDANAPEPLLAEVYSFPRAANKQVGSVSLSVEAEVIDANCGLEIEAQSLELQADGELKTQNLMLPVPDCDAKGTFLVLNNLLQDLKVAAY